MSIYSLSHQVRRLDETLCGSTPRISVLSPNTEFRNPTDEEALAGLEEEEPEDKMSPAPTPKAVAAYPVPDGNPAGPHGLGLTVVDDEE